MLPSVRNPECAWVEKVLEADRDIDVHLGEREYVFFSLVALLLAVGPVFTSSAQLLAGSKQKSGKCVLYGHISWNKKLFLFFSMP